MAEYSLSLHQAPECTHYIAVSWCWSDASDNLPKETPRPRVVDPNRPEIPLDLDVLTAAKPLSGWDFYRDIPRAQIWAVPSAQTHKWATNLTFLAPGDDSGETPAIACPDCVSHWKHSTVPFARRLQHLTVSSQAGIDSITVHSKENVARGNKAPRSVLDRAIRFAAAHRIGYIWIDKESIDQTDRDDKEVGVQSMDLVYQRSRYPLGIISDMAITIQQELDALTKLMSDRSMDLQEWGLAKDFLQRLAKSNFFTRAWISQELFASGCMILIIPCNLLLRKDMVVIGPTPGEVEIRLDGSSYGIRSWDMLSDRLADEDTKARELNRDYLEPPFHDLYLAWDALRPYSTGNPPAPNRWGADKDPNWRDVRNISSGLEILADKRNSVSTERLTILANICNFRVKLNTKGLAGFQFSTCLLALSLMNNHWTFFDPFHCPALEVNDDDQDKVFEADNLSTEERTYLRQRWYNDDHNVMVRSMNWLDQDQVSRSAQPFLTVDHQRVICKGRLWVSNKILDVRDIKRTYLSLLEADRYSESQISQHFFQQLICRCLELKLLSLACGLWQNVKVNEQAICTWLKDACGAKTNPCSTGFDSEVFIRWLIEQQGGVIPLQLLRDDCHLTHVWLQEHIKLEGFIGIAQCLDDHFQLIPDQHSFTNIRKTGRSFFECLTTGPTEEMAPMEGRLFWKLRSNLWKWESEMKRNARPDDQDRIEPSVTTGYVVKRFNAGGLVSSSDGYAVDDVPLEGAIASAAEWVKFQAVLKELERLFDVTRST
ncbi:hypothetical protein LTR17_016198 [Elasticomyces elasticus]|nr:hypothetical protein LTR17_016198 [Elasticomyces elasticus]